MHTKEIGLYVHIPFCKSKCVYCDFNTFAGIENLMPAMADALVAELSAWAVALDRPLVKTIFFGGGTPSYIPLAQFERILCHIKENFELDAGAEITLEANPDDITPQRVKNWRGVGVNRVSMGVQALDDELLAEMSRRHSVADAETAFRTLAKSGFDNLSFDLIYGWPRQTISQWQTTLKRALDWSPKHISLYALQVEPKTPLNALVASGKIPKPNDDLAADMYLLADDFLTGAGLPNYEISNWAKPGFECQHNLIYWQNAAYIGVGAGAHSSFGGKRFANIKPPQKYIQAVQNLDPSGETFEQILSSPLIDSCETIGNAERTAESAILGLRLAQGIKFTDFEPDLRTIYGEQIARFTDLRLLEATATTLKLTQKGRLLSNEVFSAFLDLATQAF